MKQNKVHLHEDGGGDNDGEVDILAPIDLILEIHVSRGHDVGNRGRSLLESLYSGQHFFEFLQDDHLVCIFRKIFDPEITHFILAILSLFSSSLRRFAFEASRPDTQLILVCQMLTFCVLIAPIPFSVRRRIFSFLSTSPIVAKIAYALKISFM